MARVHRQISVDGVQFPADPQSSSSGIQVAPVQVIAFESLDKLLLLKYSTYA